MYYLKKDKSYKTNKGLEKIHTLLSQLNNKRTDFTLSADHSIRITPGWLLGFIVGDGGFHSFVKQSGTRVNARVSLQITQTSAEIQLMYAIKLFLVDLANRNGLSIKVSMDERKPSAPSDQPAYAITIPDVVYLNNILITFLFI